MTGRPAARIDAIMPVILAGGLGTRLRAAVPDRPKAMALVGGRPILEYQLDRLARAGFHSAVLCVGYQADQIQRHFGTSYAGLSVHYAIESVLLGTGGALRNALPLVDTPLLLGLNADSWCDGDLASFVDWHHRRPAVWSMMLTQVADAGRYGAVTVGPEGEVLAFREKQAGAGTGWINAGIYLGDRSMLAGVPEHQVCSLERDLFPALIGAGLFGWQGGGRFIDIGTPESHAAAAAFFQSIDGATRPPRDDRVPSA